MRFMRSNRLRRPQKDSFSSFDLENGFGLSNLNIDSLQLGFIRKVYGILSMQLAITTLICYIAMTTHFGHWQHKHPECALLAIILNIGSMVAIFCYKDVARRVPTNYLLLLLFTLSKSYLVSSSIAYTSPKIVLIAAAMTLVMTVSLSVYAMTTKKDFTLMGGTLFIFATALFLACLFGFLYQSMMLQCLICSGCIVLYGYYLLYDTQLMIGTKRYGLSTDDYVIGSIAIYIDIVVLFMRLVKLLKMLQRSK